MKIKIVFIIFSLGIAAPVLAGFDGTPTTVPEPSTLGLFVAAALAITLLAKFKK